MVRTIVAGSGLSEAPSGPTDGPEIIGEVVPPLLDDLKNENVVPELEVVVIPEPRLVPVPNPGCAETGVVDPEPQFHDTEVEPTAFPTEEEEPVDPVDVDDPVPPERNENVTPDGEVLVVDVGAT